MGKLESEFSKRGVKVIALSCNDNDSHNKCAIAATTSTYKLQCRYTFESLCNLDANCKLKAATCYQTVQELCICTQAANVLTWLVTLCRWIPDIEAYSPGSKVFYPIIADPQRRIAYKLGILDPDEVRPCLLPCLPSAITLRVPIRTSNKAKSDSQLHSYILPMLLLTLTQHYRCDCSAMSTTRTH